MQLIPRLLALSLWCAPTTALAAEVVWLDPAPSEQETLRVAAAAGAKGAPLRPIDLRGAATAWGPADDEAYRVLDETLRDVRMFETRLDGELLIMRDLDRPIQQIGIVRGETDRDRLFAALAYEGFAVDRFFMEKLESDERAATYRADVGTVVERPWLDAVALDPDREVTPYDIAEAPQRVAYEVVREVVRRALPAEIRTVGIPADVIVSVDGRVPRPGATGGYRVVPGRHLVHAERDGVVLARWDLRLPPAGSAEISLPLSDADWTAFADAVRLGYSPAVPEGLLPSIAALGGEVWLAHVDGRGNVEATRLTADDVEPVTLGRAPQQGDEGGFSLAATLGAGWMYSGDFYAQDPANSPHAVATVNAVTTNVGGEVAWDWRLFRAVGGVDLHYTFGQYHFALYGDASTRVRTALWLGAGIRWAQLTLGFLFPYHPVGGLIGNVPLAEGLEVRMGAYLGGPSQRSRAVGDPYNTEALWGAWAGIGYRLPL